MSGSWIKDRPEAEEHPIVPLGLNEMAVPRLAIIASCVILVMLLLSMGWIAIAALSFLNQFEDAYAAVDENDLKQDGRWTWEVTMLLDDCEPRNGEWTWPDNLSAQDDVFWLPGEVQCNWPHQGQGDYATIAISNIANDSLALTIQLNTDAVSIDGEGNATTVQIEGNDAIILPLRLESDDEDITFTVTASHVSLPSAQVDLDISLFADGGEKDRHTRSENLFVSYTVWDADTNEELDSGTLPATAGDDPRYIEGFGWGLVGLDADLLDTATCAFSCTTHTVLLPPEIAYGDRDGHVLQESWLRFELELEQMLI